MMSYIIQRMPCKGFYRIAIVQLFRVDGRKRFEDATCGRVFFSKTEKNIPIRVYVERALGSVHTYRDIFENGEFFLHEKIRVHT